MDIADLNADERRFIEIMFPHLLVPDSPVSTATAPVSPSPPRQAHSTPGIMRTSSPLNLTQASLAPDWGTPISQHYQEGTVAQSPRTLPQRRRYSIISDNERAIPSHYQSQPTMGFSSNTMRHQDNIKEDSLLRKFDRSLQAEYNIRRKAYSSGPASAPVQGDGLRRRTMLAIQADNLAKAEALELFSEAVEAAERAAAEVLPPEKEREAARAYEARLVEAVSGEAASGGHPLEVVAYVGVTHPKKAIPQRH